jgi:tetratricopeptide (TPR) repeat protein
MNTIKRIFAHIWTIIGRAIAWIGRGLRRYPYIGVIILIIGITVISFTIYYRHQNTMWKNATDAYRRADYKSAYTLIKGQSIPNDPTELRIYAQTMLATQHLDQALKSYQKLYNVAKDPQTKIIIGNIYNEKHDYDKAVAIYEEIISSDPSFTQAYVNLATVRRIQGNPSKAIEVAKQGFKNNPSNIILSELVVSLTMDDKKSADYIAAIANLKRLNPNDPLLIMLKDADIR